MSICQRAWIVVYGRDFAILVGSLQIAGVRITFNHSYAKDALKLESCTTKQGENIDNYRGENSKRTVTKLLNAT